MADDEKTGVKLYENSSMYGDNSEEVTIANVRGFRWCFIFVSAFDIDKTKSFNTVFTFPVIVGTAYHFWLYNANNSENYNNMYAAYFSDYTFYKVFNSYRITISTGAIYNETNLVGLKRIIAYK